MKDWPRWEETIPSDSNALTKNVITHVEPALIYDNFIRITTYTGIFRAFQAKINI